jgi:hypothetical protein
MRRKRHRKHAHATARDDPVSSSAWRAPYVTSGIGYEWANDVNHVPYSGQEGYGENIVPFNYWPRSDTPPPPPATPPPRDPSDNFATDATENGMNSDISSFY